jgi:alkaline phosphatase D
MPVKMWDEVLRQRPQLWIWGGDIIYGDSDNMDTLRNKYARQKAKPGYQQLLSGVRVTGTYDDHDYGTNDGGKDYHWKRQSRDLLFDFLEVPTSDPARKREGAYHSRVFGPKGRQVKVINLDTRYFRDSLTRTTYVNPVNGQQEFRYEQVPGRDILGEAQWEWLEKELGRSTASINIINSSIQVISDEHRFEKWANFPTARERFFGLIARSRARGVLIISGDRHIAELSRIRLDGMDQPLYDLTSSGLTHTWSAAREEPNRYRVGELIVKKNFGVIRIDWGKPLPELTFEVRGSDNTLYAIHQLTF